jgi:hypothetical protein
VPSLDQKHRARRAGVVVRARIESSGALERGTRDEGELWGDTKRATTWEWRKAAALRYGSYGGLLLGIGTSANGLRDRVGGHISCLGRFLVHLTAYCPTSD